MGNDNAAAALNWLDEYSGDFEWIESGEGRAKGGEAGRIFRSWVRQEAAEIGKEGGEGRAKPIDAHTEERAETETVVAAVEGDKAAAPGGEAGGF